MVEFKGKNYKEKIVRTGEDECELCEVANKEDCGECFSGCPCESHSGYLAIEPKRGTPTKETLEVDDKIVSSGCGVFTENDGVGVVTAIGHHRFLVLLEDGREVLADMSSIERCTYHQEEESPRATVRIGEATFDKKEFELATKDLKPVV